MSEILAARPPHLYVWTIICSRGASLRAASPRSLPTASQDPTLSRAGLTLSIYIDRSISFFSGSFPNRLLLECSNLIRLAKGIEELSDIADKRNPGRAPNSIFDIRRREKIRCPVVSSLSSTEFQIPPPARARILPIDSYRRVHQLSLPDSVGRLRFCSCIAPAVLNRPFHS